MGTYNFTLKNTATGSQTEVKSASIQTVLKTISAFRKQDSEPIEYMKVGKKTRQVKGLHSKEVDALALEIEREILK